MHQHNNKGNHSDKNLIVIVHMPTREISFFHEGMTISSEYLDPLKANNTPEDMKIAETV